MTLRKVREIQGKRRKQKEKIKKEQKEDEKDRKQAVKRGFKRTADTILG